MLIPLYIAMYYKQDLHIHGSVSKKLYKNVTNNLWRILCDFSDDLSRVNFTVDGFKIADGNPNIIGTGLSCGVDSLSTVYDRYVKEDDLLITESTRFSSWIRAGTEIFCRSNLWICASKDTMQTKRLPMN